MYVTVQFIILEILLGLIFLVVLYFMVRELLKKIIRKELQEIKEPLQVLANYLVEISRQAAPEDPGDPDGPDPSSPSNGPSGAASRLPVASPEKLPEEPVDIANEFVQLKNTNRISAYNIRVQKIWDLYKQTKITLVQYKEELYRLKKEFGIATAEEDNATQLSPEKAAKGAKLKPLTPMPTAAPKEKVKKLSTEEENEKDTHKTKEGSNQQEADQDKDQDKDNKAASLDSL